MLDFRPELFSNRLSLPSRNFLEDGAGRRLPLLSPKTVLDPFEDLPRFVAKLTGRKWRHCNGIAWLVHSPGAAGIENPWNFAESWSIVTSLPSVAADAARRWPRATVLEGSLASFLDGPPFDVLVWMEADSAGAECTIEHLLRREGLLLAPRSACHLLGGAWHCLARWRFSFGEWACWSKATHRRGKHLQAKRVFPLAGARQ